MARKSTKVQEEQNIETVGETAEIVPEVTQEEETAPEVYQTVKLNPDKTVTIINGNKAVFTAGGMSEILIK